MLHNVLWFLDICLMLLQARYRKEQASTQPVPWIPPVDNLLKDSTDGSALGALLHFYCPQLLQLDGKDQLAWEGRCRPCNAEQVDHNTAA